MDLFEDFMMEISRIKREMKRAHGADLESLRKDLEVLREEYSTEYAFMTVREED